VSTQQILLAHPQFFWVVTFIVGEATQRQILSLTPNTKLHIYAIPKLSDFFKPQRTQRIVSYLKNKIKSVSSLCSHAINTPAKILCCYHLMSAQSKAKKRGYSLVLSQISSVPSVVNRLFLDVQIVIPVKTGIQDPRKNWVPASAGTTYDRTLTTTRQVENLFSNKR